VSEQLIASRYILGETLGQGGMGIVYRASDRLTGDTVALKQVLIASANRETHDRDDRVLTLALEFRTLAGLRHPHIVTMLDYGFDQRLPFLTMQLIAGRQTLSDYGAVQDRADKVRLLIELLEALAYLRRYVANPSRFETGQRPDLTRGRRQGHGFRAGIDAQSTVQSGEQPEQPSGDAGLYGSRTASRAASQHPIRPLFRSKSRPPSSTPKRCRSMRFSPKSRQR
jgi:hypothetical protein